MTCLVTGGAGFIGSHLVEYLLGHGERVIAIDDLSTGTHQNLAHLVGNDHLQVIVDSVLNKAVVRELVGRSDHVFHLAAAVGVDLIVKEPIRVIETNVLGTDIMLRACCDADTPVFVASTSEVYGKSNNAPFREDSDLMLGPTLRSRWSYACSKAIDEFLALAFFARDSLPVVIGRFFNTAGPRQTGQYGMVIPRFVEQALNGEPITVYGDGTQSRCFCHVSDIVPAVVALLRKRNAHGHVVNLGSRELVTIRDLAERVQQLSNSSSEIRHVRFEDAYGEGFEDIHSREPDTAKAHELIGFSPSRDLNDILGDVIRWKRAILHL